MHFYQYISNISKISNMWPKTQNLVCSISYKLFELAGASLYSPKREETQVYFIIPERKYGFVTRLVSCYTIFLIFSYRRIQIFVYALSNIRLVFLMCTFSVLFTLLLNFYGQVKNRKEFMRILNGILKIWKNLHVHDGKNVLDLFSMRKFHAFHLLCMLSISAILLAQDIIRSQLNDISTYTLAELLLLTSILERVNILLLCEVVMGDLVVELKKNEILSIRILHDHYEQLSQFVVEFTRLHSWYLLSLVINTFIWVMYNVYKFVILHFFEFRKFPTANFTMSFILSWTWTLLQMFHLSILIWALRKIQKKQRNFRFHLSGFFSRLTPEGKRTHSDMITTIYANLLQNEKERNAIVFNIDPSLLLQMVGCCTTHLMVLIGFEAMS